MPRRKTLRTPKQARSQLTVDAILDAAARILAREGPAALRTNAVARVAGVGIGSLYEYFDGRDAIVRALGERHLARIRDLVDGAFASLADAPTEVAVGWFLDALFAMYEDAPGFQRALHGELPRQLGMGPFIESDRYLESRLVAWLAPRLSPGTTRREVEDRAFVVVRAARSVTIHAIVEGRADDPALRAAIKAMVLRTLTAPVENPGWNSGVNPGVDSDDS